MKRPQPIIVTDLFPELLDELLDLLSSLAAEDWDKPTVCSRWSVKDIALHLLGGDIGLLSRKRDRFSLAGAPIKDWHELVALINTLNDLWVKATQGMSSRVLCDLLELTGAQMCEYFKTLNPYALGDPVDWAGPQPAPVWLDVAREYTERWHHQEQIRDAVGKPGLTQPRFFAPVLDAFVRALPHTYRHVDADEGTLIALTISGDAGGHWVLLRENGSWNLYVGVGREPQAEITIPQEVAWRLFTKGVSKDEARMSATINGDQSLGLKALEMVSVIA
jgi:uncharacterized protein (TIGR03083 family)